MSKGNHFGGHFQRQKQVLVLVPEQATKGIIQQVVAVIHPPLR